MTDKDQIQLIISAYLSGKATVEECRELEEWVRQSPDNNRYFQEMRNVWQVVYPAFNPSEINVFEAEKNIFANIAATKRNIPHTILLYWQRIAAILIIPLLVLSAYLYMNQDNSAYDTIEYQEVRSPHGTFSEVRLPDGTNVWLNGGSSLKYPLTFRKGERKVFLSGEGYFEVHSDKENPFVVKTDQMTLRATGTAFNIEAYTKDSITAVTMVNGKIDVVFENSSPVTMTPGERASFNNQTKQCLITQTDPYKWYAWKDGLMIFRDDPLEFVFKKIGQTFNVNITVKDSAIAKQLYRATFEDESLDEILNLLKLTAPIQYKKYGRNKTSDNQFDKLQIDVFGDKRK